MAAVPEVIVSTGDQSMPIIGMGTMAYPPAEKKTTKAAIIEAIKSGYRHFDTAFIYQTEIGLGEAIAEALRLGLIKSRADLFITSKLWCSVPAIKMSLRNLQLDYLDLYLIHWPVKISPEVGPYPVPKEILLPLDIKSVWQGMEECKNLGLTKAIGVSNFPSKKLEELLSIANIPPAVNQVEMNPLWQQKKLREFCEAKGIHVTACSPLGANKTKWGDNRIVKFNVLGRDCQGKRKNHCSALRWVYEQRVSMVAKSFNGKRMKENLDIFDWCLTEEDSNKISQLPQQKGFLAANIYGSQNEQHTIAS